MLAQAQDPVFRAETNLALVRFHVVQKKMYVADLKRDEVELLEDGRPVQITLFEGGMSVRRTVPVEIVLLFDTSGSVTEPGLLDAASLKRNLVDALPEVSLSIYRFESRMRRLVRGTRDFAQLQTAFAALLERRPAGETIALGNAGGSPIFEAITAALRDASSGSPDATRMMIVFSDGFATGKMRPEAAAKVAVELGVPVYPVALGHQRLVEKMREAVERNGPGKPPSNTMQRLEAQDAEVQEFARIGELTGGRSFDPREISPDVLRRILEFIIGQVRNEYVVGYSPDASSSKKTRKLEVRLRSKETGKVIGGTRTLAR